VVTTRQRRDVVTHLLEGFPTSARRACELVGLSRSRWHYKLRRSSHDDLRERLRELAGRGHAGGTSGFTSCSSGKAGW
jgi:hypothetical protein